MTLTTPAYTALVVDDDPGTRKLIAMLLQRDGLHVLEAATGELALGIIQQAHPDLIILDVEMPGMGGMKMLKEARRSKDCPPIILITAHSSIDIAVEAVKNGACDFIPKPFKNKELAKKVAQALAHSSWQSTQRRQTAAADVETSLPVLMGRSAIISRLIQEVERVAPTDFTVVIEGETGTGKELVARALHRQSHRAAGPFVAVDCGSIPATLIESELFGHEKGAFTGADRIRVGKFEAASGGTLFLDEVQNLPLIVQGNFLRALQERYVCRVGGSVPIQTNIRVIAASNRKLSTLVAAGQFREDLYHRLNEFALSIPPLSQRPDDIRTITQRFLALTAAELAKPNIRLSPAAADCLCNYSWPGNVRELRNVIRRAVLLAEEEVQPEHLYLPTTTSRPARPRDETPRPTEELLPGDSLKNIVRSKVASIESEVLRKVLQQTRGNKAQAARLLQIDYKTIQTKVKAYGLQSIAAPDEEDPQDSSSP